MARRTTTARTTAAGRLTKQGLLDQICAAAGLRAMKNSEGSSTPSQMVRGLARRYGVRYDSMPKTAARITRAVGLVWDSSRCDSQRTRSGGGSTIQKYGLERLLEAVRRIETRAVETGQPPSACLDPWKEPAPTLAEMDAALADLDELIAFFSAELADQPHSVFVSDTETGRSTIYGPYPDAHQATLAIDAAVARDSGATVTATIAGHATALP